MKILYLDCTNGVSGDMLLTAVADLSGIRSEITEKLDQETFDGAQHTHMHGCDHEGAGHHGRSHDEVRSLIKRSGFSRGAKEYAMRIYEHIAAAEAEVHGASIDTVHFHEVGRDEAIKNALGIGMAVEAIRPDKALISPICDGKGTILCSHGEIPVPVPAVRALMSRCDYDFRTAEVDTELVTPSGLASLMGIGAESAGDADVSAEGRIVAQTTAKGGRDTGLPGLKAYIIHTRRHEQDGKKFSEDV